MAVFPPGWHIVPASVAGPHHIERGMENQDAVACRGLGSGFVISVADGAGSRPRAAVGARLAVEAAVGSAVEAFRRPVDSLDTFASAAGDFATRCGVAFDRSVAALSADDGVVGDFATTLTVVVAFPPRFALLGVGDGFAVVSRRDGGVHLVLQPDVDDSGTTFLTSPGRVLTPYVLIDADVDGLAVGTDGVTEATLGRRSDWHGTSYYVAPTAFSGYLTVFGEHSDPTELSRRLASPEFAATSGDDKSMVVAVRR